MKPDVANAMLQLIARARKSLPFEQPEAQICAGPCQGCPLKLLGFLESELDAWEARIADGEQPGLAELSTYSHRPQGRSGYRKRGSDAEDQEQLPCRPPTIATGGAHSLSGHLITPNQLTSL